MLEGGNMATIQTHEARDVSPTIELRWSRLSLLLKKQLGEMPFRSWIMPLSPVSFASGTLTLEAPTRLVRDWVRAHHADAILALWSQNDSPAYKLDIRVSASRQPLRALTPETEPHAVTANQNQSPGESVPDAQAETPVISSPLDPRFTFENFVVGKPNELAFAAAKRVAESDGVAFNPLFLYGGVGLGKTHLMHAIAHAVRARAPARKVIYMSAEKFMYQFVRAIRHKDTMAFKEQFRAVDILMIDDIQFICGKDSTQEEFFHTFNALIDQNKHIIVSADKSPSDLDGLEERLRSRLGWGLVADIHPTTYELRLGILQSKCEMTGKSVPADVLEFLARKISSNARELEGALNRLIAHAELIGCSLSVETAQDLLQDLLRAHDRHLTVEDIQKKVAEHYNIRLADMHSPRRARVLARPRQVAMYLCKALTEYSLPEIGRKFGGRDHTTIIHGVRKIEELLAEDRGLREDVEILKRAFTA